MKYAIPEAVDFGNAEISNAHTSPSLASKTFNTIDTWRKRCRARTQLAGISSHSLQDIGISRIDALIELNKPFWEE